jgi:hypothetical protein
MIDAVYDVVLTVFTFALVAAFVYLLLWRWTLVPLAHAWRAERFGWVLAILGAWILCGFGWAVGLAYRTEHLGAVQR